MATKDTGQPANGISRRAFLASAAVATTAVGCGFDVAFDAAKAFAYESSANYKVTSTTCPYCSASCGQRVVVTTATHPDGAGHTVDIYGDFESPMNSGGLCAKGAGSIQLVNNPRRIGAWTGTHPEPNMDGSFDNVFAADGTTNGVAYKRTGDGNWAAVPLDTAMGEIATGLKTARDSDTTLWNPAAKKYNSKGVAFFGSSHMNNESNYLYRKIIANFGTSNVEHQARI
jgi:formate dehydrogenase major subunit